MFAREAERVGGNGKQRCPCQCHADLSWLKFGDTKIGVSDADAIVYGVIFSPSLGRFLVERRDCFLLIETKKPREGMSDAQRQMLERISCLPQVRVLILVIDGDNPVTMQSVTEGKWSPPIAASRDIVNDRVARWFHRVNSGKGSKS